MRYSKRIYSLISITSKLEMKNEKLYSKLVVL